jgi:uncharacterized protein (DUF2344 family)
MYNINGGTILSTNGDDISGQGGIIIKGEIIESHLHVIVSTKSELEKIKNVSTYVLFPNNLLSQIHKNTKIYKRYTIVLELIQQLELGYINESENYKYSNQFIIMKNKIDDEKKVTVETYNYKLAKKIINLIKKRFKDTPFNGEGPFLITTTDNVFSNEKKFTFLYVNLSSFNNSAIKEVLDSYKERLIDDGNVEFGFLERMKYQVLSVVTNANSEIHIFQKAVAGELE